MADSNRLTQTTLSAFSKKLERAYLEQIVLLEVGMRKGKVFTDASGIDQRWKVKTAKNPNFETFGNFDKQTFQSTDNFVEAELDYGSYRSNDWLARKEELQNRGSQEQIIDLMAQKMTDLAEDFKLDLQLQFWTGTGTNNNIVGIETPLPNGTATGTYAGLSITNNTYWQVETVDGDAGPNTAWATDALERIQLAILNATKGGANGEPDFGLCTKADFATIANRHSVNERYTPVATREMGGGQKALLVHQIEMMHDTNCTTDVIYILNSNFIHFYFLGGSMFNIVQEEAISPSGTAFHIESYPMLQIRQPRYFATIDHV